MAGEQIAATQRRGSCGGARRDERGFALMIVLAVIAMTGLVFGALLGLMMVTMKITSNHERMERERRAADGAVVATLNHLRLGTPGAGCSTIPDSLPGFELDFDLPATGNKVQVTCTAAEDEYGDPAGEVKLVGNRYAGVITDWRTAWPWAQVPGGVAGAIGASGFDPSLIHTGPLPLRFNGHVNVRSGAAPLRNPTDGSPAIEVRGDYRQGSSGVGATGPDCGALAQVGSPLFIDSVTGSTCGDPDVLSAAVPADYAIDQTVPTLPAVGGDGCPTGSVVTLVAGRYDQNATRTLNRWFGGGCPNRTYHFPTGIYWFDVNDGSLAANDRNALVINDETSAFVFGRARGWNSTTGATAGNFPAACESGVSSTEPGASIVLSGRTSLRHLGGRLAVCPYVSPADQPYPAILQQRVQPTDVTVSPGVERDFKPAVNLVSGSSDAAAGPVRVGCTVPGSKDNCIATKKFEVKLASAASSDPLRSVRLGVVGDEPNYPVTVVDYRRIDFTVTGPGGLSCSTGALAGGIDDGAETSFELLSGTCRTKLTSAAQLDGATVTASITYRYKLPVTCLSVNGCTFNAQTLEIWNVMVSVDTWTGSASRVGASDGWSNVSAVLAEDGTPGAEMQTICGLRVCGGPVPEMSVESSFTIEDVALSAPLAADDSIDSIGVVVRQLGDQAQGINTATMPGMTTVSLKLSDGSVCDREFAGVVNRVGATYYPMLSKGSSRCGDVTWAPADQRAGLLDGASVTIRMRLDCLTRNGPNCGGGLSVAYMQPVALQYVGLMATSDAYKGLVTASRLRIDSTATGKGSSANFFGSAHMPHTALDIFWSGPASGMAVFGGELQLWSLGSRMSSSAETDVVCCTKPQTTSHKVRVTAHVDGRPVVSVVAVLAPDRSRPEVLEWTQCGRNGACAGG